MLRTPVATRVAALVSVPLLLLAASCSGDDDPGDGTGSGSPTTAPTSAAPVPDVDLTGTWTLDDAQVDGAPLALDGAKITFVVDGEKVSGQATCNSYGLTVTTTGATVDFGGGELGAKTCDTPGADDLDVSYLQALAGTDTGEVTGDSLVLSSADSTLTFSAS